MLRTAITSIGRPTVSGRVITNGTTVRRVTPITMAMTTAVVSCRPLSALVVSINHGDRQWRKEERAIATSSASSVLSSSCIITTPHYNGVTMTRSSSQSWVSSIPNMTMRRFSTTPLRESPPTPATPVPVTPPTAAASSSSDNDNKGSVVIVNASTTNGSIVTGGELKGFAKVKDLWNKYGLVFGTTYFSIYFATLGMLYLAVSRGWVVAVDMASLLQKIGLEDWSHRVDPKAGAFGIAWILTKFTEPIRAALTLLITPRLARFLIIRFPAVARMLRATSLPASK